MNTDQADAFREFTSQELDVGYNYAIDSCGTRVDFGTLRIVGNHAGAIRKAKHCLPRSAATEALYAYQKRNRVTIGSDRFNAYVRSIAKMLAERNPATISKRNRDARAAELKAVG